MTKLSTIKGFGAAGGGGGSSSSVEYTGSSIVLDSYATNMTDLGWNLQITNLDAYGQAIRIRGLDTATKAYFGWNCMMLNSATPGSGYAAHCFIMFSVNQSTGAIVREGVHTVYQTSQTSDYSTFERTSDEWTGRYTYHGNIPRSGSSGHQYGYDKVLITNTSGGSVSDRSTTSSYYPVGNGSHLNYVFPSQRKHGGAVVHTMRSYNSSSQARVLQYSYYDNNNSVSSSITHDGANTGTNQTSTNYPINVFWQWDTTYTQPYYTILHLFREGLYGRRSDNGNWQQISTSLSFSQQTWGFHLSSGKIVLYNNGNLYKIDTSGNLTAHNDIHSTLGLNIMGSYASARFCWNVNQDEWLQALPDGQFYRFKFDPSTCLETTSKALKVSSLFYSSFDSYYQYKTGLFSSSSLTSVNYSSQSYTFGNENSLGHGFGQKKMVFMGGSDSDDRIYVKSYDFTNLITQLTY